MDNITFTFKKVKILTDPSITTYPNVITRVYWSIVFTDGISESTAAGVTDLNTSSIENFVDIGDVTDNMLRDWVIAVQGGSAFIEMLKGIHAPVIAKKTEESKLVVYYQDAKSAFFSPKGF